MEVSVDLETYSEVDLTACGVHVYANHPSTDVLCMSFSNGVITVTWTPGESLPKWLIDHIESGGKLVAFNAAFERLLWQAVLVRKYGFPPTKLRQWWCTAARAACLGTPRKLEHVGKFLGLKMTKDNIGKNVMMNLCRPNDTGRRPIPNEVALKALIAYCEQDVESEMAVAEATRPMQDVERKVWLLDQEINDRGLYVDVDYAAAAMRLWDSYQPVLNDRIAQLTGGITGTQVQELKSWIADEIGQYVPSIAKDAVDRLLENPNLPDKVRQVLLLRQEVGATAVKKYKRFVQCAGADNRIRGTLFYHAGSTGRWGGRLIQPQNFVKTALSDAEIPLAMDLVRKQDYEAIEAIWGSVGDVLGSLCRPTVRAAPGNRLIVADFNAIEARVLAWLAGQDDMIEQFKLWDKYKRPENDPYRVMAGRIYKTDVNSIGKGKRRGIGKFVVLGCGFGMGAVKFRETLLKQAGMRVTEEFAQLCIDTYRGSSPCVTNLWSMAQRGAVYSIENPTKRVRIRKYEMWMDGKWWYMGLPSTRQLAYYGVELRPGKFNRPEIYFKGVDNQSGQVRTEKTYSGKLVENAVQAIARDLLTAAMFRLEEAGYRITVTVHDEIVAEVPENFGSLKEMCEIMSVVPDWAEGLPVATEGYEGMFYKKD
jgi:DNA polymerase